MDRVALALSFGGWASAQQYNWQEERTPHKKTGVCRAPTDYRSHAGPAIRRPEKRHVSSLLREKRQKTEYTSTCTRILAKGTHNHWKHISTCRGNTYHHSSSGGTHISGGVARDVFGKKQGDTYLCYSGHSE